MLGFAPCWVVELMVEYAFARMQTEHQCQAAMLAAVDSVGWRRIHCEDRFWRLFGASQL